MHLPLIGLKFGAGVDTMVDSMQSIPSGNSLLTSIDG